MFRTKPSFVLRSALRAASAAGIAALAIAAVADVKTTSKMSFSFSAGMAKPMVMDITSYYKTGIMRMDESNGNSFIMDSKTKKTIVLNRNDKTYSEMTMNSITGAPAEMMKQMHMSISGHLLPTNKRKTIAGKPAQRYTMNLMISANIPTQGGAPSPGSINGVMTGGFWTTTALHEKYSGDQMMGAFSQFLQGFAMFGDTKKLMKEFTNFKGFPLSMDMVMKITMKPAKGQATPPAGTPMSFTMTMTNDVLTVQETKLSGDLFKIPAGYTKTANAQIQPKMGNG